MAEAQFLKKLVPCCCPGRTGRHANPCTHPLLQAEDLSALPDHWRQVVCRLEAASFFVDRDGELFAFVLDYLRNGRLLLPENFKEVARLKEEALFYRAQGLLQQLQPYYQLRYPLKNGAALNGASQSGVLESGECGCGGLRASRPTSAWVWVLCGPEVGPLFLRPAPRPFPRIPRGGVRFPADFVYFCQSAAQKCNLAM